MSTLSTCSSLNDEDADPWLQNLPPFEQREGRFHLAEGRLTQKQAVEKFRSIYHAGFDDPLYLGEGAGGEREFKLKSGRMFRELLGNGEGERLLSEGSLKL